jgi:hypothetical protein
MLLEKRDSQTATPILAQTSKTSYSVHIYIYIYVCVCVCMEYIYIYICIYIQVIGRYKVAVFIRLFS